MQEVSSKPGESEKPLNEQENWVLEILDWTGSWRPGFAVQQARGFWSEIDRQFMFDEIETELYPLLIDAEERYEARRLALVKNGFVQSDMGPICHSRFIVVNCRQRGKQRGNAQRSDRTKRHSRGCWLFVWRDP
jgi:hypothetical protein